MSATVYRFLPWSRRGLAAALPGGAPDADPLPQRARLDVAVVVAGAGPDPVRTSATVHGPGDVIGLDPTVIVRTTPRPDATDVEPNYFAAVDFDQPELPWLFTPGGAPASGRLRPWLVLVVVRDRAGVSITVPAGSPLPQLTIDSGATAELPDLADSWAWAHAQLLDSDAGGGDAGTVGTALRDHPDRNVSRLVCPRRLAPGASWLACLVPAFDAGVARGLGRTPAPGTPLGPAWQGDDTVHLPVYFHWRFTTGPSGDFESLARRLRPYQVSSDVGRVKMHVGAAAPPLALPPGDPGRFLDMDGALRAPKLADGTLEQVPATLADGLATVSRLLADAADGRLDGVAAGDETDQPVGPPVYGSFAARRPVVADTDATWFRELNLDPRPRVAAGLGAEVLRTNQEEVVRAAWEQVGSVLDAEATLSRARLGLEAARRFHERHLVLQPVDRLVLLTAPLAARTPFERVTVAAAVRPTSLPDQAFDGALRRLVAPTGRVVAGAARRLGVDGGAGLRPQLVGRLAAGAPDVDPTRFPRIAITGIGAERPARAGDVADLGPLGLALTVPAADADALVERSAALAADAMPAGPARLASRPDLRTVGLLTDGHLAAAREVARTAVTVAAEHDDTGPDRVATGTLITAAGTEQVLAGLFEAAAERPAAAGFLLDAGTADAAVRVHALELGSGGHVAVRSPADGAPVRVARLTSTLLAGRTLADAIAAIPPGAIPSPSGAAAGGPAPLVVLHASADASRVRFERVRETTGVATAWDDGSHVGLDIVGAPELLDQAGDSEPAPTMTVPPLVTDAAVISRFEAASAALTAEAAWAGAAPAPRLVPFYPAGASAALLARCDPTTSHAARRDALVSLAGSPVGDIAAGIATLPGWRVAPLVDRVMAYPVLDLPAYTMLAAYDRTRFCPGIDEVPTDSVTMLETNPRFVAAFMAGLNHETNRELLWRGYPTDQRGTPFRRFWARLDGKRDVRPMHEWGDGTLAEQTADPKGDLVLLLRGQLLRRYPNTIVVAVPAEGPRTPSEDPAKVVLPVFAGAFAPDVSFFGFPLVREQVLTEPGWFFALMEPATEPRFGLDETPDPGRGPRPTRWDDTAWTDLPGVPEGAHLTSAALAALGLPGPVQQADGTAAAVFQRPFELLVLAKHLMEA